MSVSFAMHRCTHCHGGCVYWYVERPGSSAGEILLRIPDLPIPAGAKTARLVGLKRKPDGVSLAVYADGRVEHIAESPCASWKRVIRKHYRAGIRFIRLEFSGEPRT